MANEQEVLTRVSKKFRIKFVGEELFQKGEEVRVQFMLEETRGCLVCLVRRR